MRERAKSQRRRTSPVPASGGTSWFQNRPFAPLARSPVLGRPGIAPRPAELSISPPGPGLQRKKGAEEGGGEEEQAEKALVALRSGNDQSGMSPEEARQLLALDSSASDQQIRQLFKRLSLRLHPDKGGDPALFIRLNLAYSALLEVPTVKAEKPLAILPAPQEGSGGAPGGIEHIRNSCYIASLITLLSRVPQYRELFDPRLNRLPESSPGRQIQEALHPLIGNVHQGQLVEGARVGGLLELLDQLGILQRGQGGGSAIGEQQDAASVLQLLLTRVLHPGNAARFASVTRTTRQYQDPTRENVVETEVEPLLHVEPGQRLEDALAARFGTREGEPEARDQYTETVQALHFPEVLTISVMRYDARPMDMPAELSLPPSVVGRRVRPGPRYRLQGFVAHNNYESARGTGADAGHYVSYVADDQGGWFFSDDMGGGAPSDPPGQTAKHRVESKPRVEQVDIANARYGDSQAFATGLIYTYVRVRAGRTGDQRVPLGAVEQPDVPKIPDETEPKTESGPSNPATGGHQPFVHFSWSGWLRRNRLPGSEQSLLTYWREEIRPAIEALAAIGKADRVVENLLQRARELPDAKESARVAIIEEIARDINKEGRKHLPSGGALYSDFESAERFHHKSAKMKVEHWSGQEKAVNGLLEIEKGFLARLKEENRNPDLKTPMGAKRKPMPKIDIRQVWQALPTSLFNLMVSLYLEWKRGSWIDARTDEEVHQKALGSKEPGSLRSWHQNTEEQLPDISGTPVPEHAEAFHQYYRETSGTINIQAGKSDTRAAGPIGYAEYTGNGIWADVDDCKVVLDYKNGLIYVTVTHYQALKLDEGGKFKDTLGKSDEGDHNPWFCFDMSGIKIQEPRWRRSTVGSLRPSAEAFDPFRNEPAKKESSKKDKKKGRKEDKPSGTAPVDRRAVRSSLLDAYFKADKKHLPENPGSLDLLDVDTLQNTGTQEDYALVLRAYGFQVDGSSLEALFRKACANKDLVSANALVMLNNLHWSRTKQQAEIESFKALGLEKYTKVIDASEKRHGDHLFNDMETQFRGIEKQTGVAILPPELIPFFRRLRLFAVRAPNADTKAAKIAKSQGSKMDIAEESGSDVNSRVFGMAAGYLQSVVQLAAKDARMNARAENREARAAGRRRALERGLRLFFLSARDASVAHRAQQPKGVLHLIHGGSSNTQTQQESYRMQVEAQWEEFLALIPELAAYIEQQLQRQQIDWSQEMPRIPPKKEEGGTG